MKKALFLLPLVIVMVACNKSEEGSTTAGAGAGKVSDPATTVAFATVQPIFNKACVTCHGEGGKAGIDLRSYESVMKGGAKGPIVKAGDAANSMLIQALSGAGGVQQMPKNAPPLEAADIKSLTDWVQSGAKS